MTMYQGKPFLRSMMRKEIDLPGESFRSSVEWSSSAASAPSVKKAVLPSLPVDVIRTLQSPERLPPTGEARAGSRSPASGFKSGVMTSRPDLQSTSQAEAQKPPQLLASRIPERFFVRRHEAVRPMDSNCHAVWDPVEEMWQACSLISTALWSQCLSSRVSA